jgi:FkbM family methyltransferase
LRAAVPEVDNDRMDRRGFLKAIRQSVSSSFIVGGLSGATLGAGTVAAYDRRYNAHTSFAQQGEDLVIKDILGEIGVKSPITYLDVGAWDPAQDSNTYIFYEAGGHGVLVEPNPAKIRRLRRKRPRDLTLNIGVGTSTERTVSDYYLIGGPSDGELNTFSKKEADEIQARGDGVHFIEKTIKMPLENINTIMQRDLGAAPNLLSIDTEGMDLDILKTMDFERFRPDVICVETASIGTDVVNVDILRFLESKRYSARGATWENTIFVDDRHLSAPGPLTAGLRPKT